MENNGEGLKKFIEDKIGKCKELDEGFDLMNTQEDVCDGIYIYGSKQGLDNFDKAFVDAFREHIKASK